MEENRKVFIYKMTTDDGGAPCVRDNLLSLAICKPAIRSAAGRGDTILGFAANSLYRDNCLVYAARVTKNLHGKKYFTQRRYAARPDCIYRWDGTRFEWKADARFHQKSDLGHDLGEHPSYGRANVLLSKGRRNFRYFSSDCPLSYKEEYRLLKTLIENLGQGFRVNFGPKLREEIWCFLLRVWDAPWAYRETGVPDAPCGDRCRDQDEDFAAVDC